MRGKRIRCTDRRDWPLPGTQLSLSIVKEKMNGGTGAGRWVGLLVGTFNYFLCDIRNKIMN